MTATRSQPLGPFRDADFLRRLGHALALPAQPSELIRLTCKLTGEYLGASRCYFGEISNDSVVIQGDWHTPQKASIAGSYAMSDFLPSELWNEMAKSGLAISDVFLHALTRPRAENFHAISVQSFASAPFIRGGRWVVALAATDSQPRTWRPDEIELLGTVAARAWPLVEHAREELERTRAQEALRISEERLRLSCRAAGVGAWEWTLATNDVYWSPEYCDIYGLDPSAAPSFEKGLAVVVEEDRQKIEDAVLEAVHSGKEYRSEHRIDHPRKGPRWIQAIGNTVAGEDGAPLRMLGIVRDITDQRRVEDELRESERQLRALADSMPQLVWMAHADGSIFWYNRGWYAYTGTTFEQMQGWGWQSVHDPKILPDVMKNWQQSIDTGQAFEMLFPLRSARGEFRWFLTRVNPVRNSAGQVARWFGTNTDIDQVKRARELKA